jgi:hypothetical protein
MNKLRSWVTPITIGSFLVLGLTGLLMFFKVRGGLIVIAHEWLSPIFVCGGCLHIWLNWGAVRANLSRTRGIVIVGFFAALLAVSVAPFEEAGEIAWEHGHGREAIGQAAAELLLETRVSTISELTGRSPQQLRDSLGHLGVRVTSDDMALADVAAQNHINPVRVLVAVLQGD